MVNKTKQFENKKEYKIWKGLRTSFSVLIVLVLIGWFFPEDPIIYFAIYSIVLSVVYILTFVLSIIHLRMFKEKVLAIIALIGSGLGVLLFVIGFIYGVSAGL